MKPSTRGRIFGITLAIAMVVGSVAVASPADEGEFLTLLNSARSAQGLSPLTIHSDLVAGARTHTSAMVARGEIFHSTSAELGSVTTGWQVLGENVGVGPNPSVLHTAFMNSPGHRANVLG
ncbi:MAG: CAP domain-containing protein, partial [Acidimicrobiia bacterium]|nr:CAP domain-containing protein [Acidimicrobiia bacterium]